MYGSNFEWVELFQKLKEGIGNGNPKWKLHQELEERICNGNLKCLTNYQMYGRNKKIFCINDCINTKCCNYEYCNNKVLEYGIIHERMYFDDDYPIYTCYKCYEIFDGYPIEITKKKECLICYEETKLFHPWHCIHGYCKDCIDTYIDTVCKNVILFIPPKAPYPNVMNEMIKLNEKINIYEVKNKYKNDVKIKNWTFDFNIERNIYNELREEYMYDADQISTCFTCPMCKKKFYDTDKNNDKQPWKKQRIS